MPKLLPFLLTSLVVELTPGPNMAYLAILTAREGRRAGFAVVLGITLGLLVAGFVASAGLAAIILETRWLYEALRWAGILYLLWLAWQGWHDDTKTSPSNAKSAKEQSKFFLRGLITNLLNPKAIIFFVAVLPTFLDPTQSGIAQTIILVCINVAVATVIHSSVVMGANIIRPLLEDQRRSRIVRRALSLLLALVAVWLFVSTKYAPHS
jgi:threonine/homoserine/homoserine lactone efflux protein